MPRHRGITKMLDAITNRSGGTDQSGGGLDIADAYDVLRNDRRRRALAILSKHETLEKGELVDRVAAAEGATTQAARKRVYVSLQQCQLPKLTDMGVIEEREGGYALTERGDVVWEVHQAGAEVVELQNGSRGRAASLFF